VATMQEISAWYSEGIDQRASHMIVVCDTYDHSDYPRYVHGPEELRDALDSYTSAPMTRVMEVYDLGGDKVAQLVEFRAWHVEVLS
jgi:hypothetical protein